MTPALLIQLIELILNGVPELVADVEKIIAGIKGTGAAPTGTAAEVHAATDTLESKLESLTGAAGAPAAPGPPVDP